MSAPLDQAGEVFPGLERLKVLMAVRLVMVTTLLLVAAYVEAVSSDLLAFNPLYLLVGATYALTVLYAVALGLLPFRTQVHVQTAGDLLIITGLIYLTGGVRTGFMLLYLVSVLVGSVLLQRGRGLLLALLATVLYATLLAAVRLERIPEQGLPEVLWLPTKQLVYSVFVTGVTCATVGMIGSWLAQSLHRVGERLQVATGQVADLQELNQVIVDSIHSGLVTCDAAGRVLFLNEFGERLLGRSAREVWGRSVAEVFKSDTLDAATLQVRATHTALSRIEVSYECPDGTSTELGVTVSPLATAGPEASGFLLAFQDLTDVKHLEQQVRMKEKLAAVGEMAAHLAHEIRNPLGSISGSAQVLMAVAEASDERRQLLAIIDRESRRLSATLDQFLYQARPSAGSPGPVDLRSAIGEAVTLLRNAPEVGAGHAIAYTADEGPLMCLGHRNKLVQVFWNLARNGLEAMPEGGTLNVQLRREGDEIVLAVCDQGQGLEGVEPHRLFEPFRSGREMGTGLGLAIVYQIVREHRGDISVRGRRGSGTEVQVRLPLVSVAVPA